MDATLAEVAIQRALVTVIVEELAKLAQIFAQLARRHRRVLPAFPGFGAVREARRGAQTRLANLPELFLLLVVVEQLH